MKIAIKVITEWDRLNVIPFFEKHYPNCNLAWETKDVKIGYTFWVSYENLLFWDDYVAFKTPSDYPILEGVPENMELPKVEENRVGYWQTTNTREQELEETLRNICYELTGEQEAEEELEKGLGIRLASLVQQAKQLLNK